MTDGTHGNSTITEESTIPLHHQITLLLRRQISSGELKPGDMIPSESQLCSQYNVSRTTVRQALNQLVEENLIIRRRGKGSFVASPKLRRSLNHLYSFSEDMLSMGLKPFSHVLEQKVVEAADEIKGALDLPAYNSRVLQLMRVRIANNEPLLLETTYIPLYLCPDIQEVDFSSSSLYQVLQSKYDLHLHKAVETYEAVKTDRNTAACLKVRTGTSAFRIQRTAYLESGVPFEFTHSITRSDKCMFRVELYASRNKVSFHREMTP